MYKHILFTTDLTESSKKVAARARELANMFNATLSIVHVLEYVPNVYSSGTFSLPVGLDLMDIFKKNAWASLIELAKEFQISGDNCYLEINNIKHGVVDLAVKLGADLLVVGSHGKHGAQLLLGSGANAILHGAKCDVLAVRV